MRAAPSGECGGVPRASVQRPDGAVAFTDDEDLALGELARQIGLTLHNAKLDSALQACSTRRAPTGARASGFAGTHCGGQRYSAGIERDIHDGVQQHLVAMAVKVRLIKQLQTQNPVKAAELLDSLGGDLNDTLQELRDLADGIYLPLLADKAHGSARLCAARRAAPA